MLLQCKCRFRQVSRCHLALFHHHRCHPGSITLATLFSWYEQMKAELTKQRITWLPVHDAELIFLKVTPRANGDVSLSVAAKLHKDEPMDELFKLGLKTRSFRLTFENSWQIVFNILAVAGGKETI